jgi:hypothetical protein
VSVSKSLHEHFLKRNRDVLKRDKQNAADSQLQEICPVINHVEAPPILQARESERNSPHIAPERPVRRSDLMKAYHERWVVSIWNP